MQEIFVQVRNLNFCVNILDLHVDVKRGDLLYVGK